MCWCAVKKLLTHAKASRRILYIRRLYRVVLTLGQQITTNRD